MIPENGTTTHPGEILREEFLQPLEITQVKLAGHLGIPLQRINELINGKRGITPETAWLLAGALGTTPEFWMTLQTMFDLTSNRPTGKIVPLVDAR